MICATTVRRASGFRQSFVSTSVRYPLAVHEDQIKKSTPDRQLTCQRAKTSE